MFQRMACVAACLAFLLAGATTVSAQAKKKDDLADLKIRETIDHTAERRIEMAIEDDIKEVIAGVADEGVRGARERLTKLANDPAGTPAFKAAVATAVVKMLNDRINNAITNRNRMATAMLVAAMKNPESLRVLIDLLADRYQSVRYWAAKGLAGDEVMDVIRTGENLDTALVLEKVKTAVTGETSPIIVNELIKVIGGVKSEAATDLLVKTVAEKARKLDLSQPDAVDAMTTAVEALGVAYERELRPAAQGKQPIIACLVQILVQTPPEKDSLDLVLLLDRKLSQLTNERSKLVTAVENCRKQPKMNPLIQTVDIIWLRQLNWMERLLATPKKEFRLLSRLPALNWTPEKSVEAIKKIIGE